MKSKLTYNNRKRGQSLVEFALVIPILVLTLMGIVEFGRIFMVQQVITNASREGARVAILPSSTTDTVIQIVGEYLSAGNLNEPSDIEMTNVGPHVQPGSTTSVTVNYQLTLLSGSIIPGLADTITLSNTTVMRHE